MEKNIKKAEHPQKGCFKPKIINTMNEVLIILRYYNLTIPYNTIFYSNKGFQEASKSCVGVTVSDIEMYSSHHLFCVCVCVHFAQPISCISGT